jgi:hypothetical protein
LEFSQNPFESVCNLLAGRVFPDITLSQPGIHPKSCIVSFPKFPGYPLFWGKFQDGERKHLFWVMQSNFPYEQWVLTASERNGSENVQEFDQNFLTV